MSMYSIAWESGPSAQIELFSPAQGVAADYYRLKFTPTLRRTLRSPVTGLRLGPGELAPIAKSLNQLVGAADTRSAAAGLALPNRDAVMELAEDIGDSLFQLVLSGDVEVELSNDDLFIELGLDEALLEYPWELMFDGTEFLCLKHAVGRFVNLSRPIAPSGRRIEPPVRSPLSILVISVPSPQPRSQTEKYERLPQAEVETTAIVDMLAARGDAVEVTALVGRNASWANVSKALKPPNRFHVIHFSGHAFFDAATPYASSLVLDDQNMSTGQILGFSKRNPPVLFFMNGCETATMGATNQDWRGRYDIFGLARAFLETGAFLLGNRWKIGDAAAAVFAKTFYTELLDGKPLGRAVRDARRACRAQSPNDFSWASYTFYGDPRLCFRQLIDQQSQL
jgi:CHAT domain-containing protein